MIVNAFDARLSYYANRDGMRRLSIPTRRQSTGTKRTQGAKEPTEAGSLSCPRLRAFRSLSDCCRRSFQ